MFSNKIIPNLKCASLLLAIGFTLNAAAQDNRASELDALSTTNSAAQPPLSELDALSQTDDNPFDNETIQKRREPIAVTLRALDKIVARTIDIEVPMNTKATFGTLEIVPRTCDKRPPEEFPETTTFLEIFDTRDARGSGRKSDDTQQTSTNTQSDVLEDTTLSPSTETIDAESAPTDLSSGLPGPQTEGTKIFSGWMFASSPGLNALEHAVYDVWVIDCKTRLVDQSESNDVPEGN